MSDWPQILAQCTTKFHQNSIRNVARQTCLEGKLDQFYQVSTSLWKWWHKENSVFTIHFVQWPPVNNNNISDYYKEQFIQDNNKCNSQQCQWCRRSQSDWWRRRVTAATLRWFAEISNGSSRWTDPTAGQHYTHNHLSAVCATNTSQHHTPLHSDQTICRHLLSPYYITTFLTSLFPISRSPWIT